MAGTQHSKIEVEISSMPTQEVGESIELLEEARSVLECLEIYANPNINLADYVGKAYDAERVLRRVANAAAAAPRLVVKVQGHLIEAKVMRERPL